MESTTGRVAIYLLAVSAAMASVEANLDLFKIQNLDLISPHNYWSSEHNLTLDMGVGSGCSSCEHGFFYNEPPPDDIMYIPSPPLHPSFQGLVSDVINSERQSCSFCHLFYDESEQLPNADSSRRNFNDKIIALLIAFTTISAVVCLYLISTRKSRMIASLARTTVFKSSPNTNGDHQHHIHRSLNKSGSLSDPMANPEVHSIDPCYPQTNRDKNLTSPIISDQAPHKKTAIPSKYWAQPGSIINRTIRRVPNEYEIPSSQTNSTGTSSAVYADMNNEQGNHRFFSPYNLHTYAEVREVLDSNEHFHTSSNSSAMLSESNYNNAVYSPGCIMNTAGMLNKNPLQGSVQMSDFNSMRAAPVANQSTAYDQHLDATMADAHLHHHHQTMSQEIPEMNHHHQHQHHAYHQAIYERPPPQRAQVIITSNNQGVNPSLLSYRDRVHNVI